MSPLLHLLRWDFVIQARSGFWIAAVVATIPWAMVLFYTSQGQADLLLPAMVFLDLSVIGTMFMAGAYFLERREGSIHALSMTPIRTWHWLASKVISLALLGTAVSLALVVWKKGLHAPWLPVIVAIVTLNVLFTLIGFLCAVPFDAFNSFLVANSLLFGILNLPALAFFDISHPLMWVLPSQPSLYLLRGSFEGISVGTYLGIFGLQLAWIAVAFWLCIRAYHHFVTERKGG